jgi:NADH-quinone oxidoreductase subunit C
MSAELFVGVKTLFLSQGDYRKTGQALIAHLAPADLRTAARTLLSAGLHLEDVCGLDTAEGLFAVYHFDHYTRPGRVTLRVFVDREAPEIPTISDIYQGADWHERETHDFYGIVFAGHPNMLPLLLPEDADFHPLLKEAATRVAAAAILEKGQVLSQADGFVLLDAPAPEEPGQAAAGDGN